MNSARAALKAGWRRCSRSQPLATRTFANVKHSAAAAATAATDPSALLPGQFLVGAPHPISNIRPVRFYVPADETPVEQKYREMREEAVLRDHQFWLDNNTRFEQGKAEFERRIVETKGACSIDDLSVYYKQYQLDSYERHLKYNRYVWRRSFSMVWPGVRAWAVDIRRRRARRVLAVAKHSEQGYFDRGPLAEQRLDAPQQHPSADSSPELDARRPPAPASPNSVDRRAEKIRSYY